MRSDRGSMPEKYFLAKDSFTTATDTPPWLSCSVNGRPLSMRIPKAGKYPGVTALNPELGRADGSSILGFPAIWKDTPKLPPGGMPVEAEAAVTPGKD